MLGNYLLHIWIWVKDIKNKSRTNINGREELPERIMVDMKWIDLIIRYQELMGYQEAVEKEKSNDVQIFAQTFCVLKTMLE